MANLSNMSPAAAEAFARLEGTWGRPLGVTSAYRDPEHNARVGGAKGSQHLHGNAYDIDVASLPEAERVALIEAARAAGFAGIGVYDNSLHFDVGPERAWGPSYHGDSIPGWAQGALGAPAPEQGNALAAQGGPPPEIMNALAAYAQPQFAELPPGVMDIAGSYGRGKSAYDLRHLYG